MGKYGIAARTFLILGPKTNPMGRISVRDHRLVCTSTGLRDIHRKYASWEDWRHKTSRGDLGPVPSPEWYRLEG